MSTTTAPDVTLTASAAKRINAILAKQDGVDFLRVSVVVWDIGPATRRHLHD